MTLKRFFNFKVFLLFSLSVEDAALGILQLLTDDKRGAVMEYTRNGGAKYRVFQD